MGSGYALQLLIANNSKTTEARGKMSIDLESLEI
jgi:hypothetical protein